MSMRDPKPVNALEYLASLESRVGNTLTFRPITPEDFADLRETASTVTQLYLNYADENCRLKLEQTVQPDGQRSHTATLEGAGSQGELHVVETDISGEAFAHYASQPEYPRLSKQRYQISPGAAIDWYDTGETILKVDAAINSVDAFTIPPDTYEYLDSPLFDDEFRAHSTEDNERQSSPRELTAAEIAFEIAQHQRQVEKTSDPYTFVTIAGRSGSGKSTLRETVMKTLDNTSIAVLSTDDYHRGLTFLTNYNREVNGSDTPWDDWDTRIVYDVDLARNEIEQLLKGEDGEPVGKRAYDFGKQEPAEITEPIQPARIIILDGLHAGDPVFGDLAHLRFEAPTGVATSIWRRLERDLNSDRATGDNVNSSDKILRYMIERAEPAYQAQKR